MHLLVHVKNKAIAISCGDGMQPVRWLANVGTSRFDDVQGRSLGQPIGVKLEDGTMLSLTQSLADAGLTDMQHVWVVYKAFSPPANTSSSVGGRRIIATEEDD